MGDVSQKLNKILDTKAAIRNAIIDKGVDVGEDVVFADYPAKISAIQSSGGDDFLAMRTLDGTDMNHLFYGYKGTELDVSGFDTGNTNDMSEMFAYCPSLSELDLSGFNTDNVNNMSCMFGGCIKLTELNISDFDMTNVNDTTYMFDMCIKLHTIRLDNCDNVTISKIITSPGFPTDAISGVTRKIYCKEANATGLTPPTNLVFEYVE